MTFPCRFRPAATRLALVCEFVVAASCSNFKDRNNGIVVQNCAAGLDIVLAVEAGLLHIPTRKLPSDIEMGQSSEGNECIAMATGA